MNVLLTGGSGFLGSHIAEQLNSDGVSIKALVRTTSNTSFLQKLKNVELIYGSITDPDTLDKAIEGVDAVIHAAGLVKARNEEEFHSVNAGTTEALLSALAAKASTPIRRVVLVSSLAAAGPAVDQDTIRNDKTANPVTSYGRSKWAAERIAGEFADRLPITILRPVALYGPRDREVLNFFRSIKSGYLPYFGSTQNRVMFLFGPDCARACIAAIDADVPSGSAFLLDDGKVYTWEELFRAGESAMGKRAFIRVPLPRTLLNLVAIGTEKYGRLRNKAVMLTRDKMKELYGEFVTESEDSRVALSWRPRTSMPEGMRITADWYKDNGWL